MIKDTKSILTWHPYVSKFKGQLWHRIIKDFLNRLATYEWKVWQNQISPAQRKIIADEWKSTLPLIEAARKELGIGEFLDPDDDNAIPLIKEARKKFCVKEAPAMPTIRVYDERLPQVQTPSTPSRAATGTGGISAVGFAALTGSLFRTYDSNGV